MIFGAISAIDKRDSPRFIKKTRINRRRIHKFKPIMTFDDAMQMYWCEACGNWVSKQRKEEHERL